MATDAAWTGFIAAARLDAAKDYNSHAARFLCELSHYMEQRYKVSDVEVLYDLISAPLVAEKITAEKVAVETSKAAVLAAVDAVTSVVKPVAEPEEVVK